MRACFALVSWLVVGCGEPSENTSSGAGGDGAGGGASGEGATTPSTSSVGTTSSTSGATTSGAVSTSAASSSSTAASSSSTGGGEACVSALASPNEEPTPGRCEGGSAVVCDVATSTLVTTPCAADETCTTFDVIEHVFDADLTFHENRTYGWAACIPDDAPRCDMVFDGFNWGAESLLAACEGTAKTWCDAPPLPDYGDAANLRIGTTLGYVHASECAPGESCREPLAGAGTLPTTLACLPEEAPTCDAFGERCEGTSRIYCDLSYGFEVTQDCGADACMMGCDGVGHCVPSGTTTCDPDATAACDTEDTYTYCVDSWCLTSEIDCDDYLFDTQTGMTIPGHCVEVDFGPTCLEEGQFPCDSSAAETCEGEVAHRCWQGLPSEVDCGAAGLTCLVGTGGEAGCTFDGALACEPGTSCNGTVLEGCCPEWGYLAMGLTVLPCAPGYEASVDCAALEFPQTCHQRPDFAECAP